MEVSLSSQKNTERKKHARMPSNTANSLLFDTIILRGALIYDYIQNSFNDESEGLKIKGQF